MKKLYFSLAAGSQRKTARILNYPDILISFMTRTNSPPKYNYQSLFIDSGGFYSSMRSGKYTKPDREYLEFIEKVQPEFFALRDYPCEPQLLKKHDLTAKQNIQRTVDNHIVLMDLLSEYQIISQPVPVIQGWQKEDYLNCIDAFNDAGLLSDYMAIGSVCRRTTISNIREIVVAIRDAISSWTKLHGFGVKLTALSDLAIWNALYSVDSGAWDYTARWKKLRGDISIPDASLDAALNYIKKVKQLHDTHHYQKQIIGDYL